MQKFVLNHPDYARFVNLDIFKKAHSGDKESQDFCMVNFNTCQIEFKAFYLLKTMDGDTRYTNEHLLGFDNFDDYLPLFWLKKPFKKLKS